MPTKHYLDRLLNSHYAWAAVFFVFIILTNRWLDWYSAIDFLTAHDADSYLAIAKAAPGLPEYGITYYYGQRFFSSWVVGCVSQFTGIEFEKTFFLFVVLCFLGIAYVLLSYFKILKLPLKWAMVLFCLYFLNPYTTRYYLLIPGLLEDVVYTLGLSIVTLGMVKDSRSLMLGGFALSILGRQTALMALPGFLLWHWVVKDRFRFALICTALVICLYQWTSWVALSFAQGKTNNLWHIFALFGWLASERFSLIELLEFTLRLALPFLFCGAIFFGFATKSYSFSSHPVKKLFNAIRLAIDALWLVLVKRRRENWVLFLALVLMGLGPSLQPFLSSPWLTGRNAGRLSSLGLVAVVMALGFYLSQIRNVKAQGRRSFWIFFPIVFGSFHHMFSIIGPPSASLFALGQFIMMVLIFLLVRAESKIAK
ncbi:MAG: hypothetical protein AB7F43_08735 [Bacteriovoracia bacterium]